MTAPGNGRTWPPVGKSNRSLDDHLMRVVVATMNNAVDSLNRAVTARRLGTPEGADHIRKLSQVVAGVTLDALRTWPSGNQ